MRNALGIVVAAQMIAGWAAAGDLDKIEAAPAGWTGKVFEPSFGFPASVPAETHPWEAIDFRSDPEGYMGAVLAYVLEGQDTATWRVQDNPIRPWFHAPWMGPGGSGREFISGMTRERNSRPGELGPGQTKCRQNWAVSFYNPAGGHTLGRVWAPVRSDTGEPDFAALPFPVGTVAAKLLVTEATAAEVPLLAGAPEVEANIHVDPNPADNACPVPANGATLSPRAPATLRLLQLDVAVRDARPDATTGWVFGTFVYDGRQFGTDPWAKLEPVGLMWGNDPALSDTSAATGQAPAESVVISDFGLGRRFGRGGRMNGPVDNPASACLSCHITAQWPNPAPMVPPTNADWTIASCWFRNLGPGTAFGLAPPQAACGSAPTQGATVSLDFSLQLQFGRRNWQVAAGAPPAGPAPLAAAAATSPGEVLSIGGIQSLPAHRSGLPGMP